MAEQQIIKWEQVLLFNELNNKNQLQDGSNCVGNKTDSDSCQLIAETANQKLRKLGVRTKKSKQNKIN